MIDVMHEARTFRNMIRTSEFIPCSFIFCVDFLFKCFHAGIVMFVTVST